MTSTRLFFGLALVFTVAGLFLHLGIAFNIYFPPVAISFPLTAAMLLAWLDGSKRIKSLTQNDVSVNPWTSAWRQWPLAVRYILVFLAAYAVLNFIFVLAISADSPGWIDSNPGYTKLRGVSAFWVLFYSFYSSTFLLKQNY